MAQPAKPGTPPPSQSQPQQPAVPARPATGQTLRRLKKGELLFAEGENSRAMYFLKSGMIRIFKKKGDANIEIDTVHAGQVTGELAFLDGNPRSASGEALTDCELIEVSGPTFQEALAKTPDWLKILLKTIVGRLRASSTRIRQLETASTAFDYSSKDGKRNAHYVYLSPTDVLKIATGLLLVASRHGTSTAGSSIDIRVGLLQRYVNQIMGIPVAKITTFLDILEQSGITRTKTEENSTKTYLEDINFVERMIAYLNEENLLEPSKRHDITIRGFLIMSLIAKHLHRFGVDPVTNLKEVNLAEIRKLESTGGKEPFRLEEFPELVKLGYATALNIKSQEQVFTCIKPETFLEAYRLQRVVIAIQAVNEQKRRAGASARGGG